MTTIILGNTAYSMLEQLQGPCNWHTFCTRSIIRFEEFTLMAWLDDFQRTIKTIKSDRLEALHFHHHELDKTRLLQDIYRAINLKEK